MFKFFNKTHATVTAMVSTLSWTMPLIRGACRKKQKKLEHTKGGDEISCIEKYERHPPKMGFTPNGVSE